MQRIFRVLEELVLFDLLIPVSGNSEIPNSAFRVNLRLPRNFLCLVKLFKGFSNVKLEDNVTFSTARTRSLNSYNPANLYKYDLAFFLA